mmetsp:Transcript_25745/g.75958  ORF Transcript_25745/g.75958 Transcript_25745/m.75958 type:complete len:130 (-) Transcript_25745:18-407(-)
MPVSGVSQSSIRPFHRQPPALASRALLHCRGVRRTSLHSNVHLSLLEFFLAVPRNRLDFFFSSTNGNQREYNKESIEEEERRCGVWRSNGGGWYALLLPFFLSVIIKKVSSVKLKQARSKQSNRVRIVN